MAKAIALTYTRDTGEQVVCSRDTLDFVVCIDGEEVRRDRMRVQKGDTAQRTAERTAKAYRDSDVPLPEIGEMSPEEIAKYDVVDHTYQN